MARAIYLTFLCLAAALFGGEDITALYLSWYGDPTTTMTIQWHTPSSCKSDTIILETPDKELLFFEGTHAPFPDEQILIHAVHLNSLTPDTEYRFQIGSNPKFYTFRTAPANLDHPIRFIIGGDLYHSAKLFQKMSETAASLDPLFAVLGGDIAYAIPKHPLAANNPSRQWRNFLADWNTHLRGKRGRLIPFLVVPGNHDIAPDYYELFFSLFAFPKRELFRAIDFGDYLSLILLDTGHFQPIQGRQTLWLGKTLSERSQIPYLFSVYHIGAYPSFYSYNGKVPTNIRSNWCPLFDKYQVQAAFEHHSHTYKKTVPIKGNQKDPLGTIYFGDGCWGTPPRHTRDEWYLEKKGRKNNIYLIEISSTAASVSAIGLTGTILDQVTIIPK